VSNNYIIYHFWQKFNELEAEVKCQLTTAKGQGQGLDTCYSACTYMSQTRDQQRFTISEVAADWHEPMVPQGIMRPSIARANGQFDLYDAASRHTIAPISHTRLSPRSRSYYLFPVPLGVRG